MFFSGQQPAWRNLRTVALASSLFGALLVSNGVSARQYGYSPSTVALSSLPFEAQVTYRLVLRGGPFPYPKDGVVFGNRERLLPPEQRGYYREYTVRTPASADRGARRIVCGGREPAKPETCFYTGDHYNSFQRIVK